MTFSSALVTGGSGFIGSALVRALTEAGVAVTCLVRGDAPAPPGCSVLRVPLLSQAGAVDPGDRRVDVVFHLAAYGVAPEQRSPEAMFDANVAGTRAMVELSRRMGARAFVYSGSCSEYADCGPAGQGVRLREEAPLTATALYGASKAAGGLVGQSMAASAGLAFQWLRLFGVYGPGEGPNRLIPYILRRLSAGETVDLTPGEQMRDMLFIGDVVEGLIAAAEAALQGRLGPMNLCSGQATSIRSVAEEVAAALGCRPDRLNFGARPYRPDDIMWMVGDNGRFVASTAWRPKVGLKDGIRETIAAFHAHGSALR